MQMSTMDTETGEMIVKRVSVPIGLEELMEGLTKEILLKKPDDIYLFAAEYFSQLLLLREKGGYKVKSVRTAQSVVKQGSKQPPEKLIIRGASKQLSRQVSVRGESPVKRIDPTKRPRKDLREDKSTEKNKFLERKINLRKAEPAESKQKHIISRTASDNTDVLNKRDRSVSSTRRGRSVTKSIQVTPRQKSTSTPRKTPSTTEHDKLKPQTKDDAKQPANKPKKEVKANSPVTKISTVEEAVTPPKIVKRSQVPGNHELASALIVPQMVENIASMNQNQDNDQERYAKEAHSDLTLSVAGNLQEANKQKEHSEGDKTHDKKESDVSDGNKEQMEHPIKTEVTNDVQEDEEIDKNIDSSCTSSKTEADSSISNDKDINREATSTSSTDENITSTNISTLGDKKEDNKIEETCIEQIERQIETDLTNEVKKSGGIDETQNANSGHTSSKAEKELSISKVTDIKFKGTPSIVRNETPTISNIEDDKNTDAPMGLETVKKQDDSHVINNSDNTSDGQITNTLAGEALTSEISKKNIVDAKQSKNENSLVDEIDNKVETNNSSQKINKELTDSSIETQSKEVENKIIERQDNEDVKSLEILPNEKTLLKTESNELHRDSQKDSSEEVLKTNVHQQDSDQSKFENTIKKDEDNVESINKYISGREKYISDSNEGTIRNGAQKENSDHKNEKDDKAYPEVVKNDINPNKSVGEKIDTNEGENKDHTIHKEEDIVNQIEEGNKSVSCSTKDESKEEHSSPQSIENNSEIHINAIETEKEDTIRVKREPALDDTLGDPELSKVSEGEVIEHGENMQKKNNENDNKNSDIDAIKTENMASETIADDNKNNTQVEDEKAKEISKSDDKPHHATDESSNSSDKKQDDGNSFKDQGKTSENEVKLENETEKLERKESSKTEELTSQRNSITLKENAENKIETDKQNIKGALEENFNDNNRHSQQDKEINAIKKSDKIETENRREDDNNKEKDANIGDILMKGNLDNNIKVVEDKTEGVETDTNIENEKGKTETVLLEPENITKHNKQVENKNEKGKGNLDNLNVVEDKTEGVETNTKIENENGKTETVLLEPDNITKHNEQVENKNENGSRKVQLNNEGSIAPETKLLKSESTDLTGNDHSNKENSGEKETQEQKETAIRADKVDNDNVERINETGNINASETPVEKQKITDVAASFSPNKNSKVERRDLSIDLGQDKDDISNTTEKVDGDNLLKTDQNTLKAEESKNHDLNTDETLNTIGNIENKSFIDLENIDKTAINSESEGKSSELQKHGSSHAVENIIKSVIGLAKEGPIDHVVKKCIGDFIQGEQQHVFVDNSNSLESKETISKAKEPVEIQESILAEKTEQLTKSNNDDNKLESPKVEDDKDKVLNKDDVTKNIINSTTSLAQTGTVDEKLKACSNDVIGDFIQGEQQHVFVDNSLESKEITSKVNEPVEIEENILAEKSEKLAKSNNGDNKLESPKIEDDKDKVLNKDDVTKNIINSTTSLAPTGTVDETLKACSNDVIGDFIQGEQQHVFVDNSLESKEITSKVNEPVEIEENILAEKSEKLTKSNNGDNKLESSKVEDDKDKILNKNDVMKNIINSTISLAQTGTVDEILKAHINDFIGNEKSNVFAENIEKNNISNIDKCDQKQITPNDNESAIKETKHSLVETSNKNKSEAAVRRHSSKNLNEPETHLQKTKQGTKNINSRSSSQANIKGLDDNSRQNNKTKHEKKLRRVKTVDVIKDESKPKIEVKSRIPTADYRNRIKREKDNGKHPILIKPEKEAMKKNDKIIESAIQHKHDDNSNGATENKRYNEVEVQQNNKDLKETEILAQTSGFDNSKLRDELKAIENESKLTTFKPTFNPYILRQEIKNASLPNDEGVIDTKGPNNALAQIAAALKIQSVWRGFKVRKNRATIPPQQKSEIIEKKCSQLVLQDDIKLKENTATTDVKPDGITVGTDDSTIEIAKKEPKSDLNIINKSENTSGNTERKLSADENRNQQIIQHSKLETATVDSNKIYDDKFIEAAVMIQKIWRAFKVRKDIKQKYSENKSSQQNKQEHKVNIKMDAGKSLDTLKTPSHELKKSDIVNEKFTAAAVMIQKLWRGFKIRKIIKENREEKHKKLEKISTDTIASKEAQELSGIEPAEPKIKFQSGDIFLLTDEKFKKAAITIQKIWRGFIGRKHLKANKKQGNDNKAQQTKTIDYSVQLNKEEKKESIGELESVKKKIVENLKSDPTSHSSIEFTDLTNDQRFKKAAIKIQAVWRGFKVRKIVKHNKRDAVDDQQNTKDGNQFIHINIKNNSKTSDVTNEKSETKLEKQSANLEPPNDEFVKAAIKIQKIWRGFKVRKISKKGNLFGTRVETEKPVIESVKTEEEIHPKDKKSALKIQSLWRGYQVRKNINIIKDKLEDKMTANDASKGREISDRDILNAATKIQAGFRGYLQRRRYKRDIHNLNSIMEEDIDEKNDTKKEDTVDAVVKSLPHKDTEGLDEKKSSGSSQLSDEEVLKALDGLNKLEIPSHIPSKNKINTPTLDRSHTIQESEVVKKQSSPLLKTISYSSINDTQEDKAIHSQVTENSKDNNNNSKFAHLEMELKDTIQNITKTNEHKSLSANIPLSNETIKTTSANIETSNSKDTEKLESNNEPYLYKEQQEENIHSNVESNTQRENMDVTESGLNNSSGPNLSTNKMNQIQSVSSDEHIIGPGTKKIDNSENQATNNKDNTYEQNIPRSQKPKDESKNENNHLSPSLEHDADKLSLTNSASNSNDNFLTQSLSLDKDINESAENNIGNNTSALKFNESNEKTVHENPQGSTNTSSDITSSELDVVRNALPNDDPKSKVTDEHSTYDRPLSEDSTDSAITVINNELSRDIDDDNDNIANDGQETNNPPDDLNMLVPDDKVKETLLDHENLINDFQNKLLDQISGKNGDKTPVEDTKNKFNIEALRKELEEAGLIYNTENTVHMQHQNSKEESNVHDQLLEYLHNMDSEKDTESTTSEILNLSSRDLPDIKEEDPEAKVGDDEHQKIKNVTNTDVKGNIPEGNIDIEKIQSTLKECEDIAQEINKGIKITQTEEADPTDSTVKGVNNQIPEKQLNNNANHTGTVFCTIPKEQTSQKKYIDNKPISDHIEPININKNTDMVKDTDSEVTDNKLVEADDLPTGLSHHIETVQTNSDSGTGLAHTGELHDSDLGSLSLTSETGSQELDSLENVSTEVPIQGATQNSKLLHTGELHDTVVVPLPLKVQNELKPKLQIDGTPDAVLQNVEHSDTMPVPFTSTTEAVSEELPSDKHSTNLLHTGELHDTVVLPLSVHGLGVLNEQQEISQSKSIETPVLSLETKLTQPIQHNLTPNESPNQSSVPTYTGLLHTGELHDTVALPLCMHGLEASNDQQEVSYSKSTETSVSPLKAELTEPIQHNLTSNKSPNQSSVPTYTGLLHTGELHDTVALPLSMLGLEASNDQQEVSHSKPTETSVSPLKAELTEPIQQNLATSESLNQSTVNAYTGLLHTGELHDTVVLPLSIQAMHGLGTPNEQEVSQSKSTDTSVLPSETEMTEPIQHNLTTNDSPNQSTVPTYTGLVHTGELHDTVIPPLSIEAMHGFISNEPIQQKHVTSVSMSQPSVPQYTGLLHTGELHDTVVVPLPAVNQNTMGIEDTQSGSPRSESTPRQVDSECQTTGEVHAVPIAVQLNQAPAGVAVLTSPPSISAVHGVSSVQDDIAQAPDKGALPIESGSDFSSPSDSQSMESENRKNATNNNKSMEVEAATKIQAGFRGYQVRKQLKLKNGSSDINNQRRSARRKSSGRITDNGRISQNKAKEPNDIEEKSAVKIQAGVRGFLVRRRQKKQKTQEN